MSGQKTIEQLAQALDFRTETEYFDYCIDSFINGQYKQCEQLFNDMNKEGQKTLLQYIAQNENLVPHKPMYAFYFNLL